MLAYDYAYDLLHQPFISRPIDKKRSVTIRLKKVDILFGFEVKLARYGTPHPLKYQVVCGEQIKTGEIPPNTVWPIFEHFCYCDIGAIKAGGGCIEIRFSLDEGELPLDGYRIFGPAQGGDQFDEAEKPPYWWFDTEMATPKYYKPASYKPCDFADTINDDGAVSAAMSLRVYETADERDSRNEETFSFLGPDFSEKYSEWFYMEQSQAQEDETVVDENWSIEWEVAEQTRFMENLREEADAFFLRCFNVCGRQSAATKRIRFVQQDTDIGGRDGHIIDVRENEVIAQANSLHGLRSALTYIQDVMLCNRRPAIKKGVHRRKGLYDTRISSAMIPAPYNYMVLQSNTMLSDAYMWRYSRSGYNGLWFLVNMEELANLSNVFPEMHSEESQTGIERLKRFADLADSYGIDVYVQLTTGYFHAFPESIYQRVPSLRSFHKWGNYPCTSHEVFKAYMQDTITGMFERTRLKGVIVIYDTEGFYNCFSNNKQPACPICKEKTAVELAGDFFSELLDSVRRARPGAEVIAWSYYCDDDWNYRVLESLDVNIALMACFSQFVHFERCGVNARTDDYAACVTGPGKYFIEIEKIARQNDKRLLAKTEVSNGQEFVSLPYLPILHQHQKRWDVMAEFSLQGFMGDYIHTHFRNSPCIALMRLNCYDTTIDGTAAYESLDKIRFVARLFYGEYAGQVERAWFLFSKAFSEYFPYSAGVCRYPGPIQAGATQPFYLDPKRPMKRLSARCNCPDLSWTRLYFPKEMTVGETLENEWNDSMLTECFGSFSGLLSEGIALLEGIENIQVNKLKNMVKAMNTMVQSMMNFIAFIHLRDDEVHDQAWNTRMCVLLNKELENTEEAICLCKVDSEIGFSAEGQGTVRGGLYNAFTLAQKRNELINEMKVLREAGVNSH